MSTFLNYGCQDITEEDILSVVKILKSDYLTQGPAVQEFEDAICNYTGAKYCVAVSNATAGLHMALLALEIPVGSEGITSPNTFLASSNAMVFAGITPKFADIDSVTYNVDVDKILSKVSDKTKVIVPVHFAGRPANMAGLSRVGSEKQFRIIEDAAHAIGSKYQNGKMVGCCCYSDMTVFSFHPVKNLTTGEGGAITTNDPELYKRLLLLRSHGVTKEERDLEQNPGPWYYEMQILGFNYRMTDIQAALGTSQLKRIEKYKSRRLEIIAEYHAGLSGLYPLLTLPSRENENNICFHLFVVKLDFPGIGLSRAEVMLKLRALGIGTQVHYIPVHTQPYYKKNFGYSEGDYPNSERYYSRALSLPLYPSMTDEEVQRVIKAVIKVVYA